MKETSIQDRPSLPENALKISVMVKIAPDLTTDTSAQTKFLANQKVLFTKQSSRPKNSDSLFGSDSLFLVKNP
jgi:hypothetical protein